MTTPVAARPAHALSDGLLAGVYRGLVETCEALALRLRVAGPDSASPTPAPGWVDGARLASDPTALSTFVDAGAARIGQREGAAPRPDVAATLALHSYAWSVALLMSGPWYLQRRVPRVRPGDLRVELATGALELVPGTDFACLPDDPAARDGAPGVRVLPDEAALRAELLLAVELHLSPLLTALRPKLRRGPRVLWGLIADDLVSGIWYLGRVLEQEERAVREAGEVLPGPLHPFPGGADFRELTGTSGRTYPTRTRLGCCLYYTLRPAEACATCPRTDDAERVRRLEP